MSKNSSKPTTTQKRSVSRWYLLLLPLWVVAAFYVAQLLVAVVSMALMKMGISFKGFNPVIVSTALSVVIYGASLWIVTYLPYKLWRRRTTRREMGLSRAPRISDVGWFFPAMLSYFICTGVVIYALMKTIPDGWVNWNQEQELPFSASMLGSSFEFMLAFLTLAILVPLAEELLFRGYLFGKLRSMSKLWVTVLITSATFSVLHLGFGALSDLQWNVAIDTFVFSIVMCLMREMTGSVWVGVLMHMCKNGLAFYLLFVHPLSVPVTGGWLF